MGLSVEGVKYFNLETKNKVIEGEGALIEVLEQTSAGQGQVAEQKRSQRCESKELTLSGG